MKSPLMDMMRSLIIYQKIISIPLILLLSQLDCVGQIQSNDNNSMMGIFSNPAYTSNSDSVVRLHLFSFESWAGGSKASIYLKDIVNINNDFFREKVLGTKTTASGWAGLNITGPSLTVSPNKMMSFGLTTRLRAFANYWNVDGRLISEIEEDDKVQQQYPYNLAGINNMISNVSAWSDIGLSFSMKIIKKADYTIRSGISLHYLSGISNSSVSANINGGTINVFGGNLPYLTNSTGFVATYTSGEFFNNPSINNFFKINNGSLGLDLGLTFDYLPRKLKIGASITDIGKVNFFPDPEYSKSYDMNIPLNGGYLFFTQNFPNTPFNHLTIPLDSNGLYFKQTKINSNKYSISLPTALHLNADVLIQKKLYLNVALNTGLQPKNSVGAMYAYRSLFVVPRYETQNFSMQLPLSYQSYTGFNAGLAVRFGFLHIGSGSLLSGLFTKSKQLDAFAGIEIGLKKRKIVAKTFLDASLVSSAIAEKEYEEKKIDDVRAVTPFKSTLHGFIEAQSVNTTSGVVPFWMRSNNYGSNPIAGISASFIGRIQKDYDTSIGSKKFNWSGAFEMRANGGNQAQAILVEAYAKAKISIFQLKVGRSKDVVGIADQDLCSGSFAVSGNALGIPKVEISIPEYWGKGIVSIKGSLGHGWMGQTPFRVYPSTNYLVNSVNSYYHQFSFYGRIGKPKWKFKFLGGINHEVMWGNEKQIYGTTVFTLDLLYEYWHVISGTNEGVGYSKIGNSIGSIDQGFEMNFNTFFVSGYHQFFYDIGAIGHLANINDGLWGLSIKNNNQKKEGVYWKKLLFEILISKNQAGAPGGPITTSGAEDYYNNYLYKQGWSYKNENIGNPLLTNMNYARKNLPTGDEFIVNNRVIALHFGQESTIKGWNVVTKFTYSKNYGTWSTAPAQRVLGPLVQVNPPPYFGEVDQFSGYLEAKKQFKNGYKIGGVFAMDAGKLLYNSVGLVFKVSKSF